MSIGIYKITSPNGKVYIGQSINIKKRFEWYENLYGPDHQPKIYRSLKKYGPENHIFDTIEECSLEQLDEKEIYWKQYYINLYGWSKMLFCELYDNGGGPKSKETKNKMRQSHIGKKHSSETIQKMKNIWSNKSEEEINEISSKKRKPKPEGFGDKLSVVLTGRKDSEETKNKKSLARLGKKDSEETKNKKSQVKVGHTKNQEWKNNLSVSTSESFGRPVLQKDLQDNIIKEWKTGKQAAIELSLNYAAINACCNKNENNIPRKRDKLKIGKYSSSGYIWEFKNKIQII